MIRLKGLCGSRVVTSTGQTGIVESTRWIGEDRFARVLLDDNREIEVYVSELRRPLPNETVTPVTDRRCYAPTFGTEHVEHQDEILDESVRLQPSPPPHAQPSSPHSRP